MTVGLLAALISIVPLWLLAGGDPKRLRATRQRERAPHGRGMRMGLFGLALLPGLVLVVVAGAAAVLIWFGAVTVAGWLIAETRAPRSLISSGAT
ncbi:hypothetical protein ATO7_11448 [Oceanococcus atlanticus]|uniref:Uncharacterized protein n=1 Tax=Oceanococcus atlanticus TaxID=1317117 RepID=A0A1Y1SC46_9GAMM|nr:hypothetical protein [Oceanococcus atlanticus]ORE85905.1 hypothetical protein ATO7_11448 [Oceanococcus atlanticus]